MNFVQYTPPYNAALPSKDILKLRRELLNLSQAEVAEGAHLQLRQYQRLESGERGIETATMKTALAICAVLKLDPFVFFPEVEKMNNYIETHNKGTAAIAKEDAIPQLLQEACVRFNSVFGTEYSTDNIKVTYCTLTNAVDEYYDFTQKYRFHTEKRDISDFTSMLAEAFIGQTDIDDPKHVDGILIRVDPPEDLDNPDYYMMILIHELSHIFCTTHETSTSGKAGQRFFDLYCADEPGTPAERYNNGFINAGYAIWRELVATVAQRIVSPTYTQTIEELKPELLALAQEIRIGNPAAKSFMHRYLSDIMTSCEGCEAKKWEDLEPLLTDLPFQNIIHHCYNILCNDAFYQIIPERIEELGSMYIVAAAQNTPPEELMKFMKTFNSQLGR